MVPSDAQQPDVADARKVQVLEMPARAPGGVGDAPPGRGDAGAWSANGRADGSAC